MTPEYELEMIILDQQEKIESLNKELLESHRRAIAKAIIDAGWIHVSQAPDLCEVEYKFDDHSTMPADPIIVLVTLLFKLKAFKGRN